MLFQQTRRVSLAAQIRPDGKLKLEHTDGSGVLKERRKFREMRDMFL